jgi:hypothetical protein
MSLLEKPVACDCPAAFVLSILDTLPGSIRMAACTKSGRTDLADPMIAEPRPHDVRFHGYDLLELAEDARAWASAWPRYAVVDNARIYLPASARFESAADLNATVAAAAGQQSGATLREKLLALGIPSAGPPASLPDALAGFVQIWDGLQLNAETPVDELLDAATRFNGPNRLARDVLASRADLHELAVELLSDANPAPRKGGRYLVEEFQLTGEDIVAPIRSRLGPLNGNQTGEMYAICALLRKMGAAALFALPDLQAAAVRVEKTDYYAHKDLTELIAHLKELSSNQSKSPS